MHGVHVAVDRIDSPVGVALVMELLDELVQRYGGPDPDEPAASDLAPPSGAFIVAWHDGNALGCAGVRRHTERVGEIKRMYVRPVKRRSGIGRALLVAIEERASALGYERLILETGTKQPEAIALYTAHGYEAIEPYGLYAESSLSRCFGKDL